jgi:methyl-accepting chemotaxis protein
VPIKWRLLGAFLLILCLTAGVAAVGWVGLSGYARRVQIAAAGQDVAGLIDALAVAAEKAVAGNDPAKLELHDPLDRVQTGIASLRHTAPDDGEAISRLETAIGVFSRNVADYATQERERAALVASRFTLIDQFEAVANEIARAQGEALHAASDAAKAGLQSLIEAATSLQTLPFVTDAMHSARDAQARLAGSNSADDRVQFDAALGKLQALARNAGRRPGAEGAASSLAAVAAAARDALKDAAETETARAALPGLLTTMTKAVLDIQVGFANRLSFVVSHYEEQQLRLTAATVLREAALQVSAFSIRARLAEQALVYNHDPTAAQTITVVADEIKKASLDLVYRVRDPQTEQKINALIGQIGNYKQDLTRLLAAQERQAALLRAVDVAAGAAMAEAQQLSDTQLAAMEIERHRGDMLLGTGVGLALMTGLGLTLAIGSSVTRPLQALADVMGRLAGGDKTVEIPGRDRRDEFRRLSDAVAVFRDNALAMDRMAEERVFAEAQGKAEKRSAVLELADSLDTTVSSVIELIGSAAHDLQSTATGLTATAENTRRQAAAATDASGMARVNVAAVAAAAERLSASIDEISCRVSTSVEVAARAVNASNHTNTRVAGLSEAATKIGTVVALIRQIAKQTNLLALNATIEAARAGTAGAGFAVVAAEVKQLASQTAKATDEITVQVAAIQQATQEAVDAIEGIARTIGDMVAITMVISSAVEEQGAATSAIARNIQRVASGTAEASENMTSVSDAAQETGSAADAVLSAAAALARDSDQLKGQVRQFVQQIVNG